MNFWDPGPQPFYPSSSTSPTMPTPDQISTPTQTFTMRFAPVPEFEAAKILLRLGEELKDEGETEATIAVFHKALRLVLGVTDETDDSAP